MNGQSKIYIKGMVCERCVMVVKDELFEMGKVASNISLGEIIISPSENDFDKNELLDRLAAYGFSQVENSKVKVVAELKDLVAQVYGGDFDFPEKFRFADHVKLRQKCDYEKVRDIFISVEGMGLEQYIITFRINKIKAFLTYHEFTLADIAYKLNFTSVAHLSSQFKQQTGLTPSEFKEVKNQKTNVIFSSN